jgi:hypothetical protein
MIGVPMVKEFTKHDPGLMSLRTDSDVKGPPDGKVEFEAAVSVDPPLYDIAVLLVLFILI